MKICAVDPGTSEMGIALFEDGDLKHCALVKATSTEAMLGSLADIEWPPFFDHPQVLIIEKPTVYYKDGAKKANALIKVAMVAGAAAAVFGCDIWTNIKFVEPRTWKGSVPKKIHNNRTLDKLRGDEFAVYTERMWEVAEGLRHNVVDAIGLGFYEIGR